MRSFLGRVPVKLDVLISVMNTGRPQQEKTLERRKLPWGMAMPRRSWTNFKARPRRRFKFLVQYIAPQGIRLLLTNGWESSNNP
jgi:hypothetical protein